AVLTGSDRQRRTATTTALQSVQAHASMTLMQQAREALLSDCDPIPLRPRSAGEPQAGPRSVTSVTGLTQSFPFPAAQQVCFNRLELNEILAVYGRMVAAGEWRDYAIDMGREKAVFSIFRRATEFPLFRIEKNPRLARKQGAFSVVAPNGLILKRGPDLKRVL